MPLIFQDAELALASHSHSLTPCVELVQFTSGKKTPHKGARPVWRFFWRQTPTHAPEVGRGLSHDAWTAASYRRQKPIGAPNKTDCLFEIPKFAMLSPSSAERCRRSFWILIMIS